MMHSMHFKPRAKIKNHDDEFRRNAIDLLDSSRKPLSQVARQLGVAAATLHAWKSRYGRFGSDGVCFREAGGERGRIDLDAGRAIVARGSTCRPISSPRGSSRCLRLSSSRS
jgi:hypothetical protein